MTQEEKKLPEGLEEAAEKYRRESYNATLKPNVDGPMPEYGGSIKDAFIAGAEWMKAKMNWHSVEESPPEMDEEVIVLADRLNLGSLYAIAVAHIVDKEKAVNYNGWNIPGVKFWMPMPKIPEEQK